VLADEGIVSANVVGYQNNVVTNGTQGAGVTFKNVGGAGTMADLKITGYGESYSDNGIYCCLLDKYGRQLGDIMFWADYTEEKTTWYGWYDNGWETPYNDVTLNPGQSIWLTSDGDYYINWPSPLAK